MKILIIALASLVAIGCNVTPSANMDQTAGIRAAVEKSLIRPRSSDDPNQDEFVRLNGVSVETRNDGYVIASADLTRKSGKTDLMKLEVRRYSKDNGEVYWIAEPCQDRGPRFPDPCSPIGAQTPPPLTR